MSEFTIPKEKSTNRTLVNNRSTPWLGLPVAQLRHGYGHLKQKRRGVHAAGVKGHHDIQ